MNPDHANQFWLEYERHFTACVRAHPQRFGHPPEEALLLARKERERCSSEGVDSISIESESFRLTCEALGIEHSRQAIDRFLNQGNASPQVLTGYEEPAQGTPRIIAAKAMRWVRDWFSGAAYCPRCANNDDISIARANSDGQSRVETWHCPCGHHWKIELRECAAIADADAQPSHWIERYELHADLLAKATSSGPDTVFQALDAAITRLSNASYACGEWSSDSEERYEDAYRESALARQSLEALCARIGRGETVAPGMASSPSVEGSPVQ